MNFLRMILQIILTLFFVTLLGYFFLEKDKDTSTERDRIQSADEKNQLLQVQGTQHINWFRTLDSSVKDVAGGIIWNATRKIGLMTFKGLPTLGPEETYQLWIFDLKRQLKEPVLAQDFNVEKNKLIEGELSLEISYLPGIHEPFKFMVTRSKLYNKDFEKGSAILMAQP